jgi:hypothetical protein
MVEGIVNGGKDVEKMLRGSRRLEPLHLALSAMMPRYRQARPTSAILSRTSR